jgi:DNA-binding NtrC family response regulator
MRRILIVDDELEICRSLSELLQESGFQAFFTTEAQEALALLQKSQPDLLLLDVRMPELGGIDLLKIIKEQQHDIPVIMITGFPSFQTAVTAMRYGAINIFPKPVRFQELLREISTLLDRREARSRQNSLHPQTMPESRSQEMKKINETLTRVARTDAPVIITGESGTGKELVAQMLHRQSRRRKAAFVKVNCAAIPDTLLETELFGCEAGAYTDAKSSRAGKFEIAHQGTLFFDEIGDMDIRLQAKILRVLQEQEFERVGGHRTFTTNTRIVAATNQDIVQLIKKGAFREDLYYRLSVVEIHLPPLRERKEDIDLLSHYFLETFNELYGKKIVSMSPHVRSLLLHHDWPGNIRELRNTIERAVIFCDGREIKECDLPEQYRNLSSGSEAQNYEAAIEELDRERILEALRLSDGIKSHAAELLKIHRKTLYNKMKRLGLE